jgi:hypothetical protein
LKACSPKRTISITMSEHELPSSNGQALWLRLR